MSDEEILAMFKDRVERLAVPVHSWPGHDDHMHVCVLSANELEWLLNQVEEKKSGHDEARAADLQPNFTVSLHGDEVTLIFDDRASAEHAFELIASNPALVMTRD